MSKNSGFGKFILFCTAIGAAAAGAYYYLTKREAEIADSFDDDFDDYEDFEDDLEDEKEIKPTSRKYVDIKTSDSDSSAESTDYAQTEESTEDSKEEPSSTEEFFDDEDEK